MPFTVDLEYTAFCPQEGQPFTEESFARRSAPFTFEVGEVGLALVDLWNLGWDDGPVSETFGPDLSFERGRSHALRKRRIVKEVIAPTVDRLRELGVQVFHCNHGRFLEGYPQWQTSTTLQERQAHWERANPSQPDVSQVGGEQVGGEARQERGWHAGWREEHDELVLKSGWGMRQYRELYPQVAIPEPVRPQGGDLLVCERDQFRRLLAEQGVRVLFYMGFETDACLSRNPAYGMARMSGADCLCAVVRDGTTTYEAAETLAGLWRTRAAVLDIETRYGYSVTAGALVKAVASATPSQALPAIVGEGS